MFYFKQTSSQKITVEKALKVGDEFIKETKALLFRTDIVKRGFIHHPTE